MDEAVFAQPKRGRGRRAQTVLKELGAHPESGEPVKVLEGRYGPYVTDGSLNASLPRGKPPDQVSLEDALDLLRARAERMPVKRAARGRAKAAKAPKQGSGEKALAGKKKASGATKAKTKKKKAAADSRKSSKAAPGRASKAGAASRRTPRTRAASRRGAAAKSAGRKVTRKSK
jgi:DNA topoisomerase-1